MDAGPSTHPTFETLQAYGLGKLDDASVEVVAKHLEECPDCRRQVTEMAPDSFLGRLRDAREKHGTSVAGRAVPAGPPAGETLAEDAPVNSSSSPAMSSTGQADETSDAFNSPEETSLPSGTRVGYFGDYELLNVLGEGGMGIVYKARQLSLNRLVALKMIKASRFPCPDEIRRFQNEAEAVARLDHPNIVPIFEVGQYEDQHYFSMKLVAGESLDKRLKDYVVDPRRAARLMVDTSIAIHHAHQRGILHRDLKPANILVDSDGQPHVSDFGLAKRIDGDSELTRSGAIIGTPAYMAPEQASGTRGGVTTSTDVYGLGAILFALLTGRAPFGGTTVLDVLEQVREQTPDSPRKLNPQVPRDLEVICLKCLEKDPRQRYASADAFTEDLKRWLAGEPIAARPVGSVARFWMWSRRNPVVAGAAGLAAVSLLVVGGLSLLYAAQQTRHANEQTASTRKITVLAKSLEKEGENLKVSLTDSNRRLAMLHFERAQHAFDNGQVNHGLHWLVECWRYAAKAEDHAWQHLARANLSFWRYYTPELKGVFPHHATNTRPVFSPDGRIILTGSSNRTVQLWDAVTALPIGKPMEHQNVVRFAEFSPNGKTIVTSCGDDRAYLWDTATGLPIGGPMVCLGEVQSAKYSPDGNTVLTVIYIQKAQLWHAATALPIGEPLVLPANIQAVGFTPDSKTILTGSYDKKVKLWDATTGLRVGQTVVCQGEAEPRAFSPDGKAVLTVDPNKIARLFDTAAGLPVGSPMQHQNTIGGVKFSPDGKTILTTSRDNNTARLWDAATCRPIGEPLAHQGIVSTVAFSPDGKTVLTGCLDFRARLWDVATGLPIGRPLAHQAAVRAVAFSPDGKSILTGSDTEALLWDATGVQPFGQPLQHPSSIGHTEYSPDGTTLLTTHFAAYDGFARLSDANARLWDSNTGMPIGDLKIDGEHIEDATFSPDGKTILTLSMRDTSSRDSNVTARLWNAATSRPIDQAIKAANTAAGELNLENSMTLLGKHEAFIPDGRTTLIRISERTRRSINSATGRWTELKPSGVTAVSYRRDGKIILIATPDNTSQSFDPVAGQPIGQPLVHQAPISFAAYGPDGKTVLIGSTDNKARLWDAVTGSLIGKPLENGVPVTSVAFSPDGKIVLTGSTDNRTRLWNAVTGSPVGQPLENGGTVTFLAFSPDGRTFLTQIRDNTLRLWDAATCQPIGRPIVGDDWGRFLAYSPDGSTLVVFSGDNSLRLWHAATAQPIGQPMVHHRAVHSVAFGPDGKTVLTGTDNEARLWDTATAQPIGPPLVHEGAVTNSTFLVGKFSPDGKTVVTRRGNDQLSSNPKEATARLWRLPALVDGDLSYIKVWVETMTGLTVNDEGNIAPLVTEYWRDRRARLRQLGGPPTIDSRWLFDPVLYGADPTARARAWMERKCWAEAESAFTEVLLARPFLRSAWIERGRFYAMRSQPAKAAADFVQALALRHQDRQLLAEIAASDAIFDRTLVLVSRDKTKLTSKLLVTRAENLATRSRWDQAAIDFREAGRCIPLDAMTASHEVSTLLAGGDRDGMWRVASDLLERFRETTNYSTANTVARTLLLAPGMVADPDSPVRLAEIALKGYPKLFKHLPLNSLAAALYRAGRFEDAMRAWTKASNSGLGQENPEDWPFLAMAHHTLGHRDEARRWLSRLRTRKPGTGPNEFWNELAIGLLQSEAEAVILYDPVFPADPFAH